MLENASCDGSPPVCTCDEFYREEEGECLIGKLFAWHVVVCQMRIGLFNLFYFGLVIKCHEIMRANRSLHQNS